VLYQDACDEVYWKRVQRGNESYGSKKLGAMGSNLAAVACFFEQPWSRVTPALSEAAQPWVLNEAAFHLRALGRLTEALEPMRVSADRYVERGEWKFVASVASNVSELELVLGLVPDAVRDAEQSVTFADRSDDAPVSTVCHTTLAHALHEAGRRDEALTHFREAERLQGEHQPEFPLLYSLQGFQYCDLLLGDAECAAWRWTTGFQGASSHGKHARAALIARCREVAQRASQSIEIAERQGWLLDIALDHLTFGRAALYQGVLTDSKTDQAEPLQSAREELATAVDGLRRAGTFHHVPIALLSRAWLRFLDGNRDGAQADLDEAWQIAERGPMRLLIANVHLHRARLFHAVTPYPWKRAEDDLAGARKLIEECGYHRRDIELLALELLDSSVSKGREKWTPEKWTQLTPLVKSLAGRGAFIGDPTPLDVLIGLAKQSGRVEHAIGLFLERARVRSRMKAYDRARWDYKKVLALCEGLEQTHTQVMGEAQIELADLEFRTGLLDDAQRHLKQAAATLPQQGNEQRIARIHALLRELRLLNTEQSEDVNT
jgi:tetratricopeptide (TPR) repeat protein